MTLTQRVATVACYLGFHDWSNWRRTRKVKLTRVCRRCALRQYQYPNVDVKV